MEELYIRKGNELGKENILIVGQEQYLGGRDLSGYHPKGCMPLETDPFTSLGLTYIHATQNISLNSVKYKTDKDVHRFIKENCTDILKWMGSVGEQGIETEEAFKCIKYPAQETADELYRRILTEVKGFSNNSEKSSFTRKPFEDIKQLANEIDLSHSYFLDLCTRWGKTETIANIILSKGVKLSILVSYVGTVDSSYANLNKNSFYKDIFFFNPDNYDSKDIQKDILRKAMFNYKHVLYYLQLTSTEDVFEKRYEPLKSLNYGKVPLFIEEADFGSHTDLQLSKLKKIEFSNIFAASGTGRQKIMNLFRELKIDPKIVTRDFLIDVLHSNYEERRNKFSNIKWYRYCNVKALEKLPQYTEKNLDNWADLLALENNELVGANYFSYMFEGFFGNQIGVSEYFKGDIRRNIDGMLNQSLDVITEIFVNTNKESQEKLADIARGSVLNAAVLVLNGNYTTNKEAEDTVKNWYDENKGKRKIIICSVMANRSFSIPQIKNIVLLLNGSSIDSLNQKWPRGCTPWLNENGKVVVENLKIVDMVLYRDNKGNFEAMLSNSAACFLESRKGNLRDFVNIIKGSPKIYFYEYFLGGECPYTKALDVEDLKFALSGPNLSNVILNTAVESILNIDYDLDDDLDFLKIEDKGLGNLSRKGDITRKEYEKDTSEENTSNFSGPSSDKKDKLPGKLYHASVLLNSKNLFYDNETYKENIIYQTIKARAADEKSLLYNKKRLGIDLNFLLVLIDTLEKDLGLSIDNIVTQKKIFSKDEAKKDDSFELAKLQADFSWRWRVAFEEPFGGRNLPKIPKNHTVILAYWSSYFYRSLLKKRRPDLTIHQIEFTELFGETYKKDISTIFNSMEDGTKVEIIMNPPYGKRGTLATTVLKDLLKKCKKVFDDRKIDVHITSLNQVRSSEKEGVIEYLEKDYKLTNGEGFDAGLNSLIVGSYNIRNNGPYTKGYLLDKRNICDSDLEYWIKEGNKNLPEMTTIAHCNRSPKKYKSLVESGKLFLWGVFDLSHLVQDPEKTHGLSVDLNYYKRSLVWAGEVNKNGNDCYAFEFTSKKAKDNFRDCFFENPKNGFWSVIISQKDSYRKGVTNAINFVPNIDWENISEKPLWNTNKEQTMLNVLKDTWGEIGQKIEDLYKSERKRLFGVE